MRKWRQPLTRKSFAIIKLFKSHFVTTYAKVSPSLSSEGNEVFSPFLLLAGRKEIKVVILMMNGGDASTTYERFLLCTERKVFAWKTPVAKKQ